MIVVTANGFGVAEAHIELPSWGAWFAELRFAGDPSIVVGQTFSLMLGNVEFLCEASISGKENDRYRVQAFPVGVSKLRDKVTPTFFNSTTTSGVILSIFPSEKISFAGEDVALENVAIPGSITGWQALNHYVQQPLWFSVSGTMYIGANPLGGVKTFAQSDYNPVNGLLEVFLDDTADIWPGDIVNGFRVENVTYSVQAYNMRAICEVSSVNS